VAILDALYSHQEKFKCRNEEFLMLDPGYSLGIADFYVMFKNFWEFRPQKDQRIDRVIMQWNIRGIKIKNDENYHLQSNCFVKRIFMKIYKIFQERRWDLGNRAHMINVGLLKIKTASIVIC
jgi:hypothetical protein